MSWQRRLKDVITMTSPEGTQFEALFQSSTTSNSKKLGIFSYPNINGEIVQDLGVNSDRVSFSIYFDGPDHDLQKTLFERKLKETGLWEIDHPVNGINFYQLIDYSYSDAPVENGNYTQFDLNWIIPIHDRTITSALEQRNIIQRLTDAINNSAAVAFINNVSQTLDSATQAIRDVTDDIVALRESILSPIAKLNNSIFNLSNAIQRGINLTIADTLIDVESLSGQIQQLIQTPGLIQTSIESQVNAYSDFINGNTGLSPTDSSVESKNIVQTQEVSSLGALGGICLAISNSEIQTRSQAVQAAESLILLFDTITNNLDNTQEIFENNDIDLQYFSQSESYQDAAKLVSATLKYLIDILFKLKIEKKFTLDKMKFTPGLVIEEYGTDELYDFFIETNNLKNTEIILLPAGREVTVYV